MQAYHVQVKESMLSKVALEACGKHCLPCKLYLLVQKLHNLEEKKLQESELHQLCEYPPKNICEIFSICYHFPKNVVDIKQLNFKPFEIPRNFHFQEVYKIQHHQDQQQWQDQL